MIQIAEVSKRYGDVRALERVSLTLNRGERVGFIGSNGSGKTTLLRCLLGLLRFEGKITVAGADVAREPELALRSIAYIPQVAPPIDAPVSEVVRAYVGLRGKQDVDAVARAARLGLDLQAIGGKRFRDLSGGMKQKLLATLALTAETPILVADEPTANLDGEARAAFFDELDARPDSSIVVLCSHRFEEVTKLVGRVVELGDGRVVADGSSEQILRELPVVCVEVTLRPGSGEADEYLVARGFARRADGRLEARLGQAQKLGVVADFLRRHEASVADLAIRPIEDVGAALSGAAPRLRVVS